jgi:hypothetical protein
LRSFQILDIILEKLSDSYFRSLVLVLVLEIEKKGKRKIWVVTLDIVEALYFYTYQNKYDLQIKCQILKAITAIGVKKQIQIIDIYGATILSNKDKTTVKKLSTKLLNELKKNNLIQSTFKLINQSAIITETTKLTILLITQNKTIFFQKNINYHI